MSSIPLSLHLLIAAISIIAAIYSVKSHRGIRRIVIEFNGKNGDNGGRSDSKYPANETHPGTDGGI